MRIIKTEIRDGIEQANRGEFLALCKIAGKTIFWGLLNIPIRKAGGDWPEYSKQAAYAVGAVLPGATLSEANQGACRALRNEEGER